MRFLLDENLSPLLAELLIAGGHDAVLVREVSLARASDSRILDAALRDSRVVISADSDFGALLARSNASRPSVVFLRHQGNRRAAQIAALLVANLESVADDLTTGAIVVIDDSRIRIRSLPMSPSTE